MNVFNGRIDLSQIFNNWDDPQYTKSFGIPNSFQKYNSVIQPIKGTNYSQITVQDTTNPFRFVTGVYSSLDQDPTVHKQVAKYFYNKLLNKWITENNDLLSFVDLQGDEAKLVSSLSNLSSNNSNELTKIEFLKNKLIDKELVRHFLKKIVNENNIKWYHLNKHEDMIKPKLIKYIKSKLEELIQNK